jgi:predicted O-methyltransferase YrrM
MTTMDLEEAYAAVDRVLPELPGWCSLEKGRRLTRLVVESKTLKCVELGVYGGRSLVALAYGCKVIGAGAHVDGIDPYEANASTEGTHAEVDRQWWAGLDHEGIMRAALEAVEDLGLETYARIIRARSLDVASQYDPASIDVLHQDGNHSEEVSCAEVEAYAPKIAPFGYWVMDDIDWPTTREAQAKLVRRGFQLKETYGTWAIYRR